MPTKVNIPSSRIIPTKRVMQDLSDGNPVTVRETFAGGPATPKDVAVPATAREMILKNSGASLIKILMGADATQYFTLTGTQMTPVIKVRPGSTISVENSGGPGVLEIMFWG